MGEDRVGRPELSLCGAETPATSNPMPHRGLWLSSALLWSPKLQLLGHSPRGAPRASGKEESGSSRGGGGGEAPHQEGGGGKGSGTLPSQKSDFFPRALCSVLELRLTHPRWPGVLRGSSPGPMGAPPSPATHLMWKFWILTFL